MTYIFRACSTHHMFDTLTQTYKDLIDVVYIYVYRVVHIFRPFIILVYIKRPLFPPLTPHIVEIDAETAKHKTGCRASGSVMVKSIQEEISNQTISSNQSAAAAFSSRVSTTVCWPRIRACWLVLYILCYTYSYTWIVNWTAQINVYQKTTQAGVWTCFSRILVYALWYGGRKTVFLSAMNTKGKRL